MNLHDTTRACEVHMGVDRADFVCQERHQTDARHGIGVSDTDTQDPSPEDPVVLGEPAAPKDPALAGATKVYPFNKMVGNQPADTLDERLLVPHLFGTNSGPNPYGGRFDWSELGRTDPLGTGGN